MKRKANKREANILRLSADVSKLISACSEPTLDEDKNEGHETGYTGGKSVLF